MPPGRRRGHRDRNTPQARQQAPRQGQQGGCRDDDHTLGVPDELAKGKCVVDVGERGVEGPLHRRDQVRKVRNLQPGSKVRTQPSHGVDHCSRVAERRELFAVGPQAHHVQALLQSEEGQDGGLVAESLPKLARAHCRSCGVDVTPD